MPRKTQVAVAKAIELQRVRVGLPSQAELARRAGYSPSALNKRLSGALPMDFNDLDRLAVALDIDPFDLLDAAKRELDLQAA